MKSLWPASANGRRDSEALISSEWLRPTMDTQDILDVALRLASQSEIPADTTINVPARNARRALFGIDVEAADLLMAKEKGYDVVIAHHPTGGSATLDFPKVLVKHADILTRHGVPRAVADAAVREMQEEREPRAHAENYDRLPSIARLIGIGLMCIHNPCDEIGRRVMVARVRRTSWSRGTWLRTASASTRSSASFASGDCASTRTAELSMSEHYYYHNPV